MIWLGLLFLLWLALAVIGTPVVYIGYGFSMAADLADEQGRSPRHVYLVDLVIATVFVFLDGLLNAVVYALICLDPRPSYAFRRVMVKGYSVWFFELMTERLSRYNEDPAEWWWRRKVAAFFAAFLDGKDKKGWHIRKPAGVHQ